MPVRRGIIAPRTTIIETIIRKFNRQNRSFIVANAQNNLCHVIYASDGFCKMTGFSRSDVMQKSALCQFLHGPLTSQHAVNVIKEALYTGDEKHFEILYYKKDGTKFLCRQVIATVKCEEEDVCLYIIDFEDLSAPPPEPPEDEPSAVRLSKFDRARASFKRSFHHRMGSLRGRGLRLSSSLSPSPAEESKEPLGGISMTDQSGLETRLEQERSSVAGNEEAAEAGPNHVPTPTVPVTSQEGGQESGDSDRKNSYGLHTTSLDTIHKKSPVTDTGQLNKLHSRAATVSVLTFSSTTETVVQNPRSHTLDNISEATRNHIAKYFPNTSSESDLQKCRTSCPWDQTLSLNNVGVSEAIRQKFALPDNGSAKFFQGALHTPKMTEKVAEVLSLGADVLPEYKLQSPRIHRWTVLHYSPFKAVWDWIIQILVMYTAIFTPYTAAFLLNEPNYNIKKSRKYVDDPIAVVDMIVDVTFIIDILINFRTTYVNPSDEIVSHPGKIAYHYLRGWFLIDLVAAIPFDLIVVGSNTEETTTLIGLLKTARLLRLVRVARKIDRYSEYGAAVLLLLMATFALIAHWLACIWYAIGNAERPRLKAKVGWLDHLAEDTQQAYFPNNTGGPSIRSKYITALYFTFTSLTSVGFGNVAPTTDAEKTFTICVMLVGSLMYASIFGNVSAIIQRLYSGTSRYQIQMFRVREFIRFHKIPNPLRQRLEEYFQHAWTYTNGIDMNSVLKGFPECLQADICLHLNRNLLTNCSAFSGASPGCLRALSLKFKTTHAPPGDTLVHRGDVLTYLYFMSRGSIEILRDDIVMAILGKNDIFGENPCKHATIGKSSCNVRALTYCDLLKIHRDDLLEVLDLYPEFYPQFCKNLKITFYLRDEEQVGVDPRVSRCARRRRSGSTTQTGPDPSQTGMGTGGEAVTGPGGLILDIRPAGDGGGGPRSHFRYQQPSFDSNGVPYDRPSYLTKGFSQDDDYDHNGSSGHGILEFTTEKAGQDVTPMNLQFKEQGVTHQPRSSTFNSISGMLNQLKRSLTDIRLHGISSKHSCTDEEAPSHTGLESLLKLSSSSNNVRHRPDSTSVDTSKETQPLLDHQIPISESGLLHSDMGSFDGQPLSREDILPLNPEDMPSKNNVTTASSLFMTPQSQSSTHSLRQAPLSSSAVAGCQSVISAAFVPSTSGLPTCASCGARQPPAPAPTPADVNLKIDKLTSKLESLEQTMARDIRLILSLLRQQNTHSSTEFREQSWSEAKPRTTSVRRSLSVPQNESHFFSTEPSRSSQTGDPSGEASASASDPIHDPWTFLTPHDYQSPLTKIPRRSLSQPVNLSQGQTDWLQGEASTSQFPPSSDWLFEPLGLGYKRRQLLAARNTVSEDMMEFQVPPQTGRLNSEMVLEMLEMEPMAGESTPRAESPKTSKAS
ncbi:voltage-gated inwardly rectifying potassium channel KCNH6 isoform X3 [Bemisia tabaci]|uniref:voltage-gated inwardly rectifying potassium channel KCNH6 isoform X3 n=1 Tax=Bemisia tabaci TaxID=7038 RepID=UPI003B27B4B9